MRIAATCMFDSATNLCRTGPIGILHSDNRALLIKDACQQAFVTHQHVSAQVRVKGGETGCLVCVRKWQNVTTVCALWWVGTHRLEPLPLQVRHSALHAAANRGGLNGTRVCRCLVSTAGVATCVQCVAKDEPVSVQDLIDSVSSAAATVDTTVDYSAVLNSMLKAQTHEDAVAALPETPEDYTVPRKLVTMAAQCCTDLFCFALVATPAELHTDLARGYLCSPCCGLVSVLLLQAPQRLLGCCVHCCKSKGAGHMCASVQQHTSALLTTVCASPLCQLAVGGDVDTTAAMTGAIAGAYHRKAGIVKCVPPPRPPPPPPTKGRFLLCYCALRPATTHSHAWVA